MKILVCKKYDKIKNLNRAFFMICNVSQTLEFLFGIDNSSEIEIGKKLEFNLVDNISKKYRIIMVQLLKANSVNVEVQKGF